jgi:hypothetical protein
MDDSDYIRKQELLDALQWRLHERELQAAKLGVSADPVIRIEIESLRKEIAKLSQQMAEASDAHHHNLRVLHNLPHPDYARFVGRKEERDRLRSLLHPKARTWVIVIDGVGGIGKSSLALETAYRYLRETEAFSQEELFQAIIWVSAKELTLTADGIASRQQIVRKLDDIYKTIAITLEKDDILRTHPDEQDKLIRRALIQQRILIIIDNLEAVDDERINAFIRELPDPTKCIVTTRHRIDIAYPIRLTGLGREHAFELISQESEKKGVILKEKQTELLYNRTGGIPLAIVWCIAQIGYGYDVDSVLRQLGRLDSDITRYCFEQSMKYIRGIDAHKALISLSLFIENTDRESLGYVAGFGDDIISRDESLVQLEKLSLIYKHEDTFSVLPLVASYVLSEEPEFAKDIYKRLIEFWLQKDTWKAVQHWAKLGTKAPQALASEMIKRIDDRFWVHGDSYYLSFWVSAVMIVGGKIAKETIASTAFNLIGNDYDAWATIDCIQALGKLEEYEVLVKIIEWTRDREYIGYASAKFVRDLCIEALSNCKDDVLLQKIS